MDIKKVSMKNGSYLTYTYDGWYLKINLDRTYKRDEQYTILIDYTAKPNELNVQGSNAITDAKGLYFINPDSTQANKPTQIWTQGETEASSCWFPTIDAPNQKTTQEILITVDKRYKTLSNGLLLSSKDNGNGTRTDHWKQSLPHAPYLFMMAVGDFAIVKDQWKRKDGKTIEVNYYLEHEFEPHAKAIFGKTPKMIEYFSNLLGVEYPWEKYDQVIVRDYVSGAMENTGAVINGEFYNQTTRETIDGK
jgi:aminopeptidase N